MPYRTPVELSEHAQAPLNKEQRGAGLPCQDLLMLLLEVM